MKATFVVATLLAAALSATTHAQTQKQPACIDPATPLRTLIASYDRWPALPPGDRAQEARSLLARYLKTGDDTDYHKTLRAYENLQTDFPSNRGVRVALGLLYVAGPDMNYRGGDGYRHVALLNFSNADTRAGRLLEAAVNDDSTQWITAIALTRVALVSIETQRIEQAMRMIQRALTADPASVPLNLAWSDLLNRQERFGDALHYIEEHDAGCRVQAVAKAEALMLTGDTATGSRLYLETLEKAAPGELDRYYDDVRVMMTVAYNRTYRALPQEQRAKWLRAYWERTAAASGRTVEIRVAEQTIRAAYADTHFRSGYIPIDANFQPLAVLTDTSHVVPWDPAGIIYVRHGPPDYRYFTDEGGALFEAWVYASMQPPVIVLFSKGRLPPTPWIQIYAPPCTPAFLGRWDPEEAQARLDSGGPVTMRDIYYALSSIDSRYGELISECMFVAMGLKRIRYENLVVQYRYDNRKLFPRLVHSESSLPHFTKPVRIAAIAYEFRAADGEPEVVAMSAIPVADLTDNASQTTILRIAYAVTDSMIGSFRSDTVIEVPSRATSGLVRVPITWRNPSISNGTMRVTVMDPEDTLRGATKAVAFKLHEDRAPVSISDIVLADVGIEGPLVRGALRLSPLPDHAVQPGDAFRVFFELYGVKENEEVSTTVFIHRTDPKSIREQLRLAGKRQDRTVQFDDRVKLDARGIAIRDIEIAGDLVPGHYAIEVTVKTKGGVVAKRVGTLTVEAATAGK